MPKKETIKLRSPREEDQFGDPIGPVPGWRNVPGATVVPRESNEDERRGTIIISGFMISFPSSVEITDYDEVEVRGEVYQIEGAVGDYGRKKIFYVMRAN